RRRRRGCWWTTAATDLQPQEGSLFLIVGWLGWALLRASTEHCFIVRGLRARRPTELSHKLFIAIL
ncbi:MAG TPA: hypothetical protein VLL94_01075, partial [Nitrospiraceae bacterium]|nr:hypothetical protein [Nitrospiraceae bacterium]